MNTTPEEKVAPYGTGDVSYQTAGGELGIRRLVDAFYDRIESEPIAAQIRAMHPKDLSTSRDKLARFLCGWMNGPNRYREKYGEISLPNSHAHLTIGTAERDAWLACMEGAIADQPYPETFKAYLLTELTVPANRVTNRT